MSRDSHWRYGLLRDYDVPEMPAGKSLRGKLRVIWQQYMGRREKPAEDETDLQLSSSHDELDAPRFLQPDWNDPVRALNVFFSDERSPREAQQTIIVGPPGSGVAEVLTQWANQQADAELLQPPEPPDLLDDWSVELDGAGPLLVVPALHQFYLRHPSGLRTVRRMLGSVRSANRQAVFGCDSWAWAYLCRAVDIDSKFSAPVAPMPLGGANLQSWLLHLYKSEDEKVPYNFRLAADGSPVFCVGDTDDQARSPECEAFFTHLASVARGIPEVALAQWKNCLKRLRDEADDRPTPSDADDRPAIWVESPGEQDLLPVVPADADRVELIVLHSLLLHGGLPEEVLPRIVPFSPARVTRSLVELKGIDIVEENDGRWSVSRLAYPNVRATLASEGFLIDSC